MHWRTTCRRSGRLYVLRDLTADTADAVVALLEPVQHRYRALVADPGRVDNLLGAGRERATALASPRLEAAMQAIGLTP